MGRRGWVEPRIRDVAGFEFARGDQPVAGGWAEAVAAVDGERGARPATTAIAAAGVAVSWAPKKNRWELPNAGRVRV